MKPTKFSIVVIGSMNPAIHHPFWYQTIGGLTESETRTVLQAAATVTSAQLSQFNVAGVEVLCLPDRWQVQSADEAHINRLASLTKLIFDRLHDTPLKGFGLNIHRAAPCDIEGLDGTINPGLDSMPLGLVASDGMPPLLTKMSVVYPLNDITMPNVIVGRRMNLNIDLNRDRRELHVHVNVDHMFRPTKQPEHFQFGPVIDAAVEIRATASDLIDGVFRAASKGEGG